MDKNSVASRIKKDIRDRKKGIIRELFLNKDYAEEFNITERQVKSISMECLTPEEKRYRVSEIRSQTGKKNKGNKIFPLAELSKEQRQINNLREKISEEIFKKLSLETGWKIVKLQDKMFDDDGTFKGMKTNFENILELKNGKKICDSLKKLEKQMNNFKYPDFVREKEEVIEFVEVKSSSKTNPNEIKQKRSLEALGRMGYTVSVQVFPLDTAEMLESYKQIKGRDVDLNDLKKVLEILSDFLKTDL